MSDSRESILGKIREALRNEAPNHAHVPVARETKGPTAPFREWLPTVGPTLENRVELFGKLSEMLRTEFVRCDNIAASQKIVLKLAAENGWTKLAAHSGKLTTPLLANVGDNLSVLITDSGYDKFVLEQCDVGITECECLVAQTGSICVTTHSSGGRALSVLPPHHIVIASHEQLISDLPTAYEMLAAKYAANYPSFISFITGPSRTGDIERILVLGAHGPKKLTVLLVP